MFTVASGTDGRAAVGVYLMDKKKEGTPDRVVKVLARFREVDTADKLWKLVMEHFKGVTGSETLL